MQVPNDVDVDSEYGTYMLKFSLENDLLSIHRSFSFKKDIVPSNEYNDLKAFMDKIIKSDARQLAFRDKTNNIPNKKRKSRN